MGCPYTKEPTIYIYYQASVLLPPRNSVYFHKTEYLYQQESKPGVDKILIAYCVSVSVSVSGTPKTSGDATTAMQ
jgi:hypothetical protein